MSAGNEHATADASLRQKIVGRYALHGPISAGGMASVHFGRLLGPIGFRRTVAIKRLHAPFARDPQFVGMFLDEARLAARIHHPNVVGTLDIVEADEELFLVMDYVRGLSWSAIRRATGPVPPEHAAAVIAGTLHGLHAAHEARNAAGDSLEIVHRDVSPPNILVGADGIARVIDFGVAKARERIHSTRGNDVRGKVRYMAPEQLSREPVDRRADIYSAAVVLWEALTSRSYLTVETNNVRALIKAIEDRAPEPPSSVAADVPRALDEVVLRALARDPARRYASALEMAVAVEAAVTISGQGALAAWVSKVGEATLAEREAVLRRIETDPASETEDHEAVPSRPPPPTTTTSRSRPPPPPSRPSRPPPPPEPLTLPSDLVELEPTSVVDAKPAPPPPPPPRSRPPPPVSTSRSRSMPRRRFDVRPLAGLAAVAAVVGAWLWLSSRSEAARTSTEQAVFPPPPIVSSPSASSAAASDEPATHAAGSLAPAATISPRGVTSHPRPAARATCNPPYTLDHGIRVPKPECL